MWGWNSQVYLGIYLKGELGGIGPVGKLTLNCLELIFFRVNQYSHMQNIQMRYPRIHFHPFNTKNCFFLNPRQNKSAKLKSCDCTVVAETKMTDVTKTIKIVTNFPFAAITSPISYWWPDAKLWNCWTDKLLAQGGIIFWWGGLLSVILNIYKLCCT